MSKFPESKIDSIRAEKDKEMEKISADFLGSFKSLNRPAASDKRSKKKLEDEDFD